MKILIAIFLGIFAYLISLQAFSETQSILIGLLVLLVALWTNEGFHLGYVSLLPFCKTYSNLLTMSLFEIYFLIQRYWLNLKYKTLNPLPVSPKA
jgi:hypothetical protein